MHTGKLFFSQLMEFILWRLNCLTGYETIGVPSLLVVKLNLSDYSGISDIIAGRCLRQ